MKITKPFILITIALAIAGIHGGCKGFTHRTLNDQTDPTSDHRWEESDTSMSLFLDTDLIWQFNFNNRKGKPYFHPLNINGTSLTCESPSDHSWHLGLWFSWKFINGLNYWEYKKDFSTEKTGFQSEGITQIRDIKFRKNPDFSTHINMIIHYAPNVSGAEPVMEESRNIFVSAPSPDGNYHIDYDLSFRALDEEVLLDRTPLPGEEGGQSWGGYAGMSIRYNQELRGPGHLIPEGTQSGAKTDFLYMGFTSPTNEEVGLSIFRHPHFSTSSTSWYVIENPAIPFFYFSPSALYDHSFLLKPDESLELKYRIWILAGEMNEENLKDKYLSYSN